LTRQTASAARHESKLACMVVGSFKQRMSVMMNLNTPRTA
jgi:hypothetical protein